MAQIFQPELTDSFEIKSNTVSQSDNVIKTVQEIYNYGVSNNYGNCFILYDNADNFLKNKGGYQIRYFTLTSLLTPRKIYLGSSNYLYNNGAAAGGRKIQHAIGVAVRMRSGEYETIDVATFSTNGNSYSTIVNTNEKFTTSTGGLYGATVYINEDNYGSDYYTSYYGSGLHSGYDEVIYIDPSIYDELYIDGQLVPEANATIRVNYYLPDDDYEYARITYKKNEKPESVNDGTIVPISPNDSYVDIPKFIEGQSYWFKIFTNKSESEAFGYTVGDVPIPPEPETDYIIIYKNGKIKRTDSMVSSNPYYSSSGVDTGDVTYGAKSIDIHVVNSTHTSGTPNFAIDFNQDLTVTTFIPLISTNSQEYKTRTALSNKVHVIFDITLTMGAGSYRLPLQFIGSGIQNGSSYQRTSYIAPLLTDQSHVSGNYIVADSSSSFTINDTIDVTVFYYDYNTGRSYSIVNTAPQLMFDIGHNSYSGSSNFDLTVKIKEIYIEMCKEVYPKLTDTFMIMPGNGSSRFTLSISEIYEFVKSINYNSFFLMPYISTLYSNTTAYWIVPYNIIVPDDLYIVRDLYISFGNGYFAIGSTSITEYTASNDCYGCDSGNKFVVRASTPIGEYERTINGRNYRYSQISGVSKAAAHSYVFYTEGYKRLYVNDILIHEKKS